MNSQRQHPGHRALPTHPSPPSLRKQPGFKTHRLGIPCSRRGKCRRLADILAIATVIATAAGANGGAAVILGPAECL